MIHPDTEVRHVNEIVGCGVFATCSIPVGTIIWAPDSLDRFFTHSQVCRWPEAVREATMRYMYRDRKGRYVLGWDHARYVNHSFTPNCIITPLGFTLVVRAIAVGDQILEDYGTLNIIEPFEPLPEMGVTRTVVHTRDLEMHSEAWDHLLQQAFQSSLSVSQPLLPLLKPAMRARWMQVCRHPEKLPPLSTLLAPPPTYDGL